MVSTNFARTLEQYLPGYIKRNYTEAETVSVKVMVRPVSNDYRVAVDVVFTGNIREIKWKALPEHVMNDWNYNEPENLSAWNVKYKECNGRMCMTFEITENTADDTGVDEAELAEAEG